MKAPFFNPDTQSWHQPLDTPAEVARDVMLKFARDREGKLRKMFSEAIEAAVLAELREGYREELTDQQMKIIASCAARRAVCTLANTPAT